MQTGRGMIFDERGRQEEKEGYDYKHDDKWVNGELASAAATYILFGMHTIAGHFWPWDKKYWKPKDRISNLVRAGALIAAEIDRLQRLDTAANTASKRPETASGA